MARPCKDARGGLIKEITRQRVVTTFGGLDVPTRCPVEAQVRQDWQLRSTHNIARVVTSLCTCAFCQFCVESTSCP